MTTLAVVDAERICEYPEGCKDSNSAYSKGCRGAACTARNAEYQRERRRALARPDVIALPACVPTGQIRTHLDELRAVGIGTDRLVELSGVSKTTIQGIRSGRRTRTTERTRDRILAVMPSMLAPGALVDAALSWERIGQLQGIGWTETDLAEYLHGPGARRLRLGADQITARNARLIEELWAEEVETEPLPTALDPLAELRLLLTSLDDPTQEWRDDAECRRLTGDDRARQAPFFPTRGDEVDTARSICDACPVSTDCLDFALVTRSQGFWGGTTGGDRRAIRHLGLSATDVATMRDERPDVRLAGLLALLAADIEPETDEDEATG